MKNTQQPAGPSGEPADLPEMRRRVSQALSLISHRKPSEHLINLIELSLKGASIQDLVDVERPF